MEKEKKRDMDTVRFVSLISMFAGSAFQSMGKIANPLTGKVERDLDSARGMIDILIMLKEKTRGNLNEDEEKFLGSTISDLQMNYVQEKAKPEPAPGKKEEKKEEEKKTGPIITPPSDESGSGKQGEEEKWSPTGKARGPKT